MAEETSILDRIRRGERVEHFETVRIRKDGTPRELSLSISPVRDASGHIIGASKVARDITERNMGKRALAERALLLDLSSDAILIRDATDRIVYWNTGAWKVYGYSAEEAMGRVTHELFHTEFPEPLGHIMETIHRDNRWTGELVHTCKDGRRITVISRWVLAEDSRRSQRRVLETNNDITRQKQSEKALLESEARLRAVAEGLDAQVRFRPEELERRNAEVFQQAEQLLSTPLHSPATEPGSGKAAHSPRTARQRRTNHNGPAHEPCHFGAARKTESRGGQRSGGGGRFAATAQQRNTNHVVSVASATVGRDRAGCPKRSVGTSRA